MEGRWWMELSADELCQRTRCCRSLRGGSSMGHPSAHDRRRPPRPITAPWEFFDTFNRDHHS